jgi:hypothetical protein
MANGGWHGTEEEWQRREAPLLSIDPILEQFALEHGFAVSNKRTDSNGTVHQLGTKLKLVTLLLGRARRQQILA